LKKAIFILVLFLGIGLSNTYYSQEGGKKREKYQRKGKKRGNFRLTQYKSRGHADEFARAQGRRGVFSRLFKKKESQGWVYRSTNRKSNYKANRYLFKRYRSKGRDENEQVTSRQNSERSKRREHGNRSFRFKKYKTK
jgi:hypothetical protein